MENPINSKILATAEIYRNLSSDQLYQAAIDNGEGRASKYKALVVATGDKTGRSANDKFFVKEKSSQDKIHWGETNVPMKEENFNKILKAFEAYAQEKKLYVHDLFGGADRDFALPVTIITEFAWHGLFSRHMLVRPSTEELKKFIEKVWAWKDESGGIILDQLKKLGCSCDWSRSRFTMDKDLSKAVIKVFVDLYNNKLIYKDKKLVNWDTQLQTAISDLEVVQKEVQSQLYYIDYQLENSDTKITIATTRPETMMGDTAIAVNPKDDRYLNLIGKNVKIPVVNRTIKIIADRYADPEQGSGAVKITPAHDFNDYEVGRRNKLQIINIFEKDGKINKNGIKEYVGLDRFEARKLLIKQLKDDGKLVKIETIKNKVPYGDRSSTIIEPLLTEQWFVDAKKLSKKPMKIVNDGKTSFFPQNWTKTFFLWMKNIEPWCISRQIWWGHRIPAWYLSLIHISEPTRPY